MVRHPLIFTSNYFDNFYQRSLHDIGRLDWVCTVCHADKQTVSLVSISVDFSGNRAWRNILSFLRNQVIDVESVDSKMCNKDLIVADIMLTCTDASYMTNAVPLHKREKSRTITPQKVVLTPQRKLLQKL